MSTRTRARALAAALTTLALTAVAAPGAHAEDSDRRRFVASGAEIAAAPDAGSAPVITPGLWKDRLATSEGKRYYKVKRAPGTAVFAALTFTEPDMDNGGTTKLSLTTPGGTVCGSSDEIALSKGTGGGPVTAQVSAHGPEPDSTPGDGGECANAPELLLAVERTKGPDIDAEVLLMMQPPVRSAAGLPTATSWSSSPSSTVAASGDVKEVRGGSSFTDATAVEPGVVQDRIWPGETAYFRVRLDYGQSLAATVEAPAKGVDYPVDRKQFASLDLGAGLFSPARGLQAENHENWYLNDAEPETLNLQLPAVNYLNQFGYGVKTSIPGWYYIAVGVAPSSTPAINRVPVPVRVRIEVDGQAGGQPQFVTAEKAQMTDAPTPSASETGVEDGMLPWILAGTAGTLLLLGGLGYLLVRRRRRA